MSDADGRAVIIYIGEFYNYRELKKELEANGVRFRCNSDTKVVLSAYHEYGRSALGRFNGIIVFAVVNAKD